MPRQAKRPVSRATDKEITADEVNQMFVAAIKREPRPDTAACQVVATIMNNHRGFFMRESNQRRAEAHKAALALQKFMDELPGRIKDEPWLLGLPSDLRDLHIALKRCAPFFRPVPTHTDWLPMAIVLAQAVAHVLVDIRRTAGHTRDSVLVQFLELALKRMGYTGATRAMIAENFREHSIRPQATNPTESTGAKP